MTAADIPGAADLEAPHGAASTSVSAPSPLLEAFGDWTPRAVVFDCDGLLLDTESVWQRAQDAVVAQHAAPLHQRDEEELHGSTIELAATIIAERAGSDREQVLADLHREFDRELGTGIRLMPGALDVLRAVSARVPVGCASNSWLSALEHKLTDAGLRQYMSVLEASDTVERPKPAADMYAAAARALGVPAADTLALEDSGTGARAARDAGLRLITVPTSPAPVPGADAVLDSLTDPHLLAWIATW